MLTVKQAAGICHEANREYCFQLGDESQPEWHGAPLWQVRSAMEGVLFHMKHPDAGPEASHESWLKEKELAGWKYGIMKNEVTKEHPCFVPYDQLPEDQQLKDHLFTAIVSALKPFIRLPGVGEPSVLDELNEAPEADAGSQ